MRIVIASVAAAAVAVLGFSAEAATSTKKKQRHIASKEKTVRIPRGSDEFGYDAAPEHYRVGTREWWRAMEREGRGGFGDNM